MSPPETGPDPRESTILRAVVEEYINTAKPVGSGSIAKSAEVNVSSATVRNAMAALEAQGYLTQPHTSAGRIPTDAGYRFFVDSLARPGRLAKAQVARVDEFFAETYGEIEKMLSDASKLLSNITNHAAVVVAEPLPDANVCSVQLVGVSTDTVLGVFVLSDASVRKLAIDREDTFTDDVLDGVATELREALDGKPLAHLDSLTPDTATLNGALIDTLVSAWAESVAESDEAVFVGGASLMADDFDAVSTVGEVLTILEEQLVVVSLIRDVLDRGRQVAIGTETGLGSLAECSLVVAPYEVDGEMTGSIGVLGPTRMNYGQALAAVAVVSDKIGDRLRTG